MELPLTQRSAAADPNEGDDVKSGPHAQDVSDLWRTG
jgi:hypothetical protein